MAQYIDKAALVAEIEKRIEFCARQREEMVNAQFYTLADDATSRMSELSCFKDFINTLEVKEVDLNATDKQKQQWVEKACDVYCKDCEYIGCDKFECLALEKFRKAMEE